MKHNFIGRKFIAALIDYSIIITLDYYLILYFGKAVEDQTGSYELTGLPPLITILPWLLFTVAFEYFMGSTFGNGLVSLKPFNKENHDTKITFTQSFQRHLLDPIDMFFFGLVGYLVMKNNKGQRLGDLWANTIVLKYIG